MITTINVDGRDHPELRRKLEHASEILEGALGNSAGSARARWDLLQDQGPAGPRPLIRLALQDGITGDRAEADFAPDELDRDTVLRYRFHDLWFELLSGRTRRHRERFERLAGSGETG